MRKTLMLGTLITLLVALVTGTAYAHFLAYSAVDDQGTDEVMHFAVDPSADSIRNRIDNATSGADSWDKLDCFYSSACAGVDWQEVTVAQAKAMDNAVVIQAQPNSPSPETFLYGEYHHSDTSYDTITFYLDVFTLYGNTKQEDEVLHETGHSLGLAHAPCSNANSVMVAGCFNSLGHPGKHDKADYKDLWVTGDGPGSIALQQNSTPEYTIYDYAN